jgi:hypothetical protein
MHYFLQIHPSKTGPLFTHFGGQPLTRYQFVATLTQCFKILGIDSTKYNSHSFKIGAATTLAMQCVGSDTIQAAGRWRSNVFRSYIRFIPSYIYYSIFSIYYSSLCLPLSPN